MFNGIRPDNEPDSFSSPSPSRTRMRLREDLGIETLVVRGRDRMDFFDVGVAGLRKALERAYEMGREQA